MKNSYVYRFKEMNESREEAINNANLVIEQQELLISVLKEYDETHEGDNFKVLIEQLEKQVEDANTHINKLKEGIIKCEDLIKLLESNDEYNNVATLVCDELGIFKSSDEDVE